MKYSTKVLDGMELLKDSVKEIFVSAVKMGSFQVLL